MKRKDPFEDIKKELEAAKAARGKKPDGSNTKTTLNWSMQSSKEVKAYVVEFSINGNASNGVHIIFGENEEQVKKKSGEIVEEWVKSKSLDGAMVTGNLISTVTVDHIFESHLLPNRTPFSLVVQPETSEDYAKENPKHWANLCKLLLDSKADGVEEKRVLEKMIKRLS